MSSAEDIAEIVRGLSEAQREGLLGAAPCKTGELWTPYQRHFRNGFGRPELVRGGTLTKLGLQVRAALEKGNRDG